MHVSEMCVCLYVWMSTCMCVCAFVRACVRVCVRARSQTHARTYVRMLACIHNYVPAANRHDNYPFSFRRRQRPAKAKSRQRVMTSSQTRTTPQSSRQSDRSCPSVKAPYFRSQRSSLFSQSFSSWMFGKEKTCCLRQRQRTIRVYLCISDISYI